MEGRVFESFQKNQKIFKIPKMPKFDPKIVPTCFEDVLGWFFRKNFSPSVPWRVASSKIFKKIKKVSKFQKCPKSSPKESKRKFSKKIKKKFQNSKNAQNRPQKCPNVFWTYFGLFFLKKFFAQCSMEGRVFENFQKNQKSFKIPKMPKIVPKKVQTKIFKVKKIFKSPKKPKSFPNCPNVFWTCFGVIFSKKIFAQCSMEGRVFGILQKKSKNFQSSKNAQNRPQNCPNENFQKNQKSFKIPKMPKIVPKRVQKCFEDVLG